MVWAALNYAIEAAESQELEGDLERWRTVRSDVYREVMQRGFSAERNAFTQHYDTTEVDAALLVLPSVGFIEATDPKFLGTLSAIESDLMRDGFLMRYRTESGVDGLSGDESPFLVCSFWLVSAYARVGRHDDARELMDRLVALVNDVGLLAEEYDVTNRRMLGNYPQAFSHLGLVSAALDIAAAEEAAVTCEVNETAAAEAAGG